MFSGLWFVLNNDLVHHFGIERARCGVFMTSLVPRAWDWICGLAPGYGGCEDNLWDRGIILC